MLRICLLSFTLIALLTGCNISGSPAESTPEIAQQASLTCDELVTTALETVNNVCSELGRNQACYGNSLVEAEFKAQVEGVFGTVGDIVDLLSLKLLRTTPLNEASQTWGVALIKAQANVPDNLPGQNVTFLLYGGTTMDNLSPDMRTVILQTGFRGLSCADAPSSAALIQSPDGAQVALNINGADVTLGSTIYITAEQNAEMKIATIEGSAIVQASGITQIVNPGAQVSIPLGSTGGLTVIGPPSDPQPFEQSLIQAAPLNLLEQQVPIPDPATAAPTRTPSNLLPPVTETLPPVTLALPPTLTATPCAPRTDWLETYTIAGGDTLFTIAQRFNLTLAQLQQGNCITDANQIFSGQVLRVPFALTASTETPLATSAAAGSATPTEASFRADSTTITNGECTTLRWEVENVDTVYLEGQPANQTGVQRVCPQRTTRYTLLVVHPDNNQVPYFVSITVE